MVTEQVVATDTVHPVCGPKAHRQNWQYDDAGYQSGAQAAQQHRHLEPGGLARPRAHQHFGPRLRAHRGCVRGLECGIMRLPRSRGRFVDLGTTRGLLLLACLLRRPWASAIPGQSAA